MSYQKAQLVMSAMIVERSEIKIPDADKEIMAAAFHVMIGGIATGKVGDDIIKQHRFLMGVMDTAMEMLNALYVKETQ